MHPRLTPCALVLVSIAACDAEPSQPGAKPDPVERTDTPPGTPATPPTPPSSPPPPSTPPPQDTALPPEPSPAVSPVAAAAESVRKWASANDHGGKLPEQLFRPTSPLTLAIEIDACDGEPSECISRLDLPDAAAFEAWLTDNVGELPGLDVSTTIESCTDDCCTFANLGREAAKEGGMVPHELLELRAVCFEVDQQTLLGVRRMKFVEW